MSQGPFDEKYAGSAPENYEKYFVPAIGAPVAEDLVQAAALNPGERVLDVACGTGVVTRLAAERVGPTGSVAGLDANPGMLAVARSLAPEGVSMDWYETSAEAMPLPDESFDVVLCQMGLQFIPNKLAALREMRRVLAPGGRLVLNLPGPTPPPFAVMAEALSRHISAESAGFARLVFSLHDPDELKELIGGAGFEEIAVHRATKSLRLPAPGEFLWQYAHSTPLAGLIAQADEQERRELEREVCEKWQEFVVEGVFMLEVDVTTVTAKK